VDGLGDDDDESDGGGGSGSSAAVGRSPVRATRGRGGAGRGGKGGRGGGQSAAKKRVARRVEVGDSSEDGEEEAASSTTSSTSSPPSSDGDDDDDSDGSDDSDSFQGDSEGSASPPPPRKRPAPKPASEVGGQGDAAAGHGADDSSVEAPAQPSSQIRRAAGSPSERWTAAEKEALMSGYAAHGRNVAKIHRLFLPTRTPQQVRNWLYNNRAKVALWPRGDGTSGTADTMSESASSVQPHEGDSGGATDDADAPMAPDTTARPSLMDVGFAPYQAAAAQVASSADSDGDVHADGGAVEPADNAAGEGGADV